MKKTQCDVCGKMEECTMVIVHGIETMACDKCLGGYDE